MSARLRRSRSGAVALLSGGLDSVVATTAAEREFGVRLAITFDYGQRAAGNEVAAARRVAKQLGVPWRLIKLPWFAELLPSGVAKGRVRPAAEFASSWVPNRNGVFLNVAAAWAEFLGADRVIAGFNREEAASFPDNTAEFVERSSSALELSTLSHVRVVSPTLGLDKPDIVKLGVRLDAPLRAIWSCYGGGRWMCGTCLSCSKLVRAFSEACAPASFWPERLPKSLQKA